MRLLAQALTPHLLGLRMLGLSMPVAAPQMLPQQPRPLGLEDAFSLLRFQAWPRQAAALSSDGEWVAYAACDPRRFAPDRRTTDRNAIPAYAVTDRMGCDIWVTNVTTGHSRKLTQGTGNSWSPSWSPDGRFLAFYSDRDGEPRVWLWEARRESIHRLSPAVARTVYGWEVPLWAPDSRRLIVKLRPISMTGTEVAAAPHPYVEPGADTVKIPGSTVAVYRSTPPGQRGASVPRDSFATQPAGNDWLGDLAVVETATRRVRIVAYGVRSNRYLFSPDGSRIAYLDATARVSEGEDASQHAYLVNIIMVDVATGQSRVAVRGIRDWQAISLSWSPDGRWLAYVSGSTAAPSTSGSSISRSHFLRGDLYIVPSSGGPSRKFHSAPDYQFELDYTTYLLWGAVGQHVYVIGGGRLWQAGVDSGRLMPLPLPPGVVPKAIIQTADGTRCWTSDRGASLYVMTIDSATKKAGVYKVQVAGGEVTMLREVDEHDNSADHPPIGSLDGRRVIFRAQTATQSEDLWVADPRFEHLRRLTMLNSHLPQYAFGPSRLIQFSNARGQPLQGALFLPPDYVEGKRYPLIVLVYGGALGSWWVNAFGIHSSWMNMHILTTRGYAVLHPDLPVYIGTQTEDLLGAAMPAVDRAVDLGIADSDRLAVMGHSYGGYSTLALLTRTTRFRAAVMASGISNLTALYGTMLPSGAGAWIPYLESSIRGMGAPPWEVPLRYIENSPLFSLNRVRTPLLVEAGNADAGLVSESDAVFVSLKRLGHDVTYLRYDGEGHDLRQVPNAIDFWTRVLTFFGDHLRPGPASKPTRSR